MTPEQNVKRKLDQIIRCSCDNEQLEEVGCDCPASRISVTLHIWPKGYADQAGPQYLKGPFQLTDNIRQLVWANFGNWAIIFDVTQRNLDEKSVKMTPEFEAYCDMMSKNDNS